MTNPTEREVSFLVSVSVESASDGGVPLRQAKRAARQAVRNALWDREESGFDHDQDTSLVVRLVGIDLFTGRRRDK